MSDGLKIISPNGNKYKVTDLITVRKVQELFGVTHITVYSWLGKLNDISVYSDGRFPNAFKYNKRIYIPVSDVENVIKNAQHPFDKISNKSGRRN